MDPFLLLRLDHTQEGVGMPSALTMSSAWPRSIAWTGWMPAPSSPAKKTASHAMDGASAMSLAASHGAAATSAIIWRPKPSAPSLFTKGYSHALRQVRP